MKVIKYGTRLGTYKVEMNLFAQVEKRNDEIVGANHKIQIF